MEFFSILVLIIIIALIMAARCILVVHQSEVFIIENLGKFSRIADAGIHFLFPFVEKAHHKIDLRTQTMDVPPQDVITRDNVTIQIDTIVFYQITDPVKAVYEIRDLRFSIASLAQTTLRDLVGKMNLDDTFSSRDAINTQLRIVLDEATDKWGCKVERVEVKNIAPRSAEIRDAMEKQMNAERTKRAMILDAEGIRQSAITKAEGEKQAAILNAEAEKQSKIIRAEGVKEAKILEATGEADAIRQIAEAKAKEVELVYDAIMNAKPNDKLIALKSLEALEKVADGQANKVFIPFDATQTLASVSAMFEAKN